MQKGQSSHKSYDKWMVLKDKYEITKEQAAAGIPRIGDNTRKGKEASKTHLFM